MYPIQFVKDIIICWNNFLRNSTLSMLIKIKKCTENNFLFVLEQIQATIIQVSEHQNSKSGTKKIVGYLPLAEKSLKVKTSAEIDPL